MKKQQPPVVSVPIPPRCVHQVLARIVRQGGFADSFTTRYQGMALEWLKRRRHIELLCVYPNGHNYRILKREVEVPPHQTRYAFVGEYLKTCRQIRAFFHRNPGGEVRIYCNTERTLTSWRGDFTSALMRRINHKGGLPDWRGRRDDMDYQAALRRDQRKLIDHAERHVAIHSFETDEARTRFSHLISEDRC